MSKEKNKTDNNTQHPSRQQFINQVQQAFQQAQQLQKTGYLNEAENLYRQILEVNPKQPDCLHYLGLICLQKGNPHQAADYMQQSITYGNNPVFLCNYGMLLGQQGNHDEAIKQYRKALETRPDYPEAWFNLGVSYSNSGKPELAEDAYRNAVVHRKNYIKALYNLACVQEIQESMDEAKATFAKILGITPRTADEYNIYGQALSKIGGRENRKKAEQYFRKALKSRPDYLEVYFNLGKLFNEGNMVEDAIRYYREVLEREPDHLEARLCLASSLIMIDELNEAQKILEKILATNPQNSRALCGLGNIKRISGDFDAAIAFYEQVLDINDSDAQAYYGLSACKKYSDEDVEFIEKIKKLANVNAAANFALGNIFDDIGNYDEAFAYYKKANKLRNNRINYNAVQNTEYTDNIISVFSDELINQYRDCGNPAELPIFILGAPRSGTTLTEQIISSHPEVYGAGELEYISQLINQIRLSNSMGKAYPECIEDLQGQDFLLIANEYIEKIRSLCRDNDIKRITDKMPGNFKNIGLISLLFPNAGIIHCRRHPLDTCLSIYFQSFDSGHQYSFDLENLGYWYRDYSRLMDHWHRLLPGHIYTVDYDELVNNTETEARKLIEKCGLEWDDRCLDFYRESRSVHTASSWQVRQPIYKTSLERWKHYDKHIGPLKEILAGYY